MPNPSLAKFGQSAVDRGYNTYDEAMAYQKKKGPRDILKMAVMPAAMFATGGLGSAALMGGGAGAGAGSGFATKDILGVANQIGSLGGGSGAAPILGVGAGVSKGLSVGNILNSNLAGLGVNALSSVMAGRSQNKAQRYATDAQERGLQQQMELERARLASEQENLRLDREDAARRWAAEQELAKRTLAADEEDRAYTRGITEAEEARRAARNAVAQRAQMSIMRLLGMG